MQVPCGGSHISALPYLLLHCALPQSLTALRTASHPGLLSPVAATSRPRPLTHRRLQPHRTHPELCAALKELERQVAVMGEGLPEGGGDEELAAVVAEAEVGVGVCEAFACVAGSTVGGKGRCSLGRWGPVTHAGGGGPRGGCAVSNWFIACHPSHPSCCSPSQMYEAEFVLPVSEEELAAAQAAERERREAEAEAGEEEEQEVVPPSSAKKKGAKGSSKKRRGGEEDGEGRWHGVLAG